MDINTQLLVGESETQYLWRLGNLKDSGAIDLGWREIADLINHAFKDETEYISESAYRKKYSAAKLFRDEVFSKTEQESTQDQIRELEKLRMKLRDERTAYNKQNRDAARLDENFSILSDELKTIGRTNFTESTSIYKSASNNDLIVCLSDLHIGERFNNAFGCYDSDIAKERLDKYLNEAITIGTRHNSENAYVCLLGDLINGNLRLTVQLANRENIIEQIKLSAQYISSFCFELSKHFKNVYIYGVAGNHSRLVQNKEDAVKDERADSLIIWIVQQMLNHVDNIQVHIASLDTTVETMIVRGNIFALAHGDYDQPSDSSIGKLMLMLGVVPYGVLTGHRHSMYYREFNGIKYIQAGSLCGSGDDYTIQKRLIGDPNQTILVCNKDGVEAIYNVKLL